MPLLIGQAVDARELEEATSQWSPGRFCSMCDALAWAASGRLCPTLPSFTMRWNAPDGGIDAEWFVEVKDTPDRLPTPLIGAGWNVFQYKKRDVIARGRKEIVSNVKSKLRRAVTNLAASHHRHPDRYVLFVNVDPKHEAVAIKDAILEGYPRASEVHVEVVGAAELAALLNNHPHLRAAYFAPLSFKTWQEADRAHRTQKLFGSSVPLVGREEEVKRLRSVVDDRPVRAIVITGSHDIGKTRLALAVTEHRPHDVVVVLDPRSMSVADYRSLAASHGETICIVEDPEFDSLRSLISEVLTLSNLKMVVTLPTGARIPEHSYGLDERVRAFHLGPLRDEDARALLRASQRPLDFGIESWILSQAKGIPGILLAAASVGSGLRREAADFIQEVGREFEHRIESELGEDSLHCARLFSALTHVGISGESGSELKLVCEIFGSGWGPPDALAELLRLEQAGLAKRGGSFAEISIPILASHLVATLLRGQKEGMFALFARLEQAGRLRFLKRLSEVCGEEVDAFWDEMFAPDGPFGNLESALQHAHMLRLVSGTVPERTLRLLESGLLTSSVDERRAIAGDERRELMWALDQLLFRSKTGRGAMKLMFLLAEAENETYGNNATGVFTECLHPLHPQMPLPLAERMQALREFTAPEVSKEGKLVAIKAGASALDRTGFHTLRQSTGVQPLDSRPPFTHEDFYNYARDVVDRLMLLAEDSDTEIAEAALSVLPELIAECGIQGRPPDALDRFKVLMEKARAGIEALDVSSLLSAIGQMHHVLSDRIEKSGFPLDRREEFLNYIGELDHLTSLLEEVGFDVRLRRWAGRWTHEDHKCEVVDGKDVYRHEQELKALAKETTEHPSLLGVGTIRWLLSDSAQKSHIYFFHLGQQDTSGACRTRIEKLGRQADGSSAFAAYWGGWAGNDKEAAEERLDELAASDAVSGPAIVQATGWLEASQAAVDRVKTQIHRGRVDPGLVARVLAAGGWIESLTQSQFEDLLRAIAGDHFQHASSAIDLLGMWLHDKRPLSGTLADFAWLCLEADPPVEPPLGSWNFDQLAAELTRADPERGFRLLEKLLLREHDLTRWNPLDPHAEHQFWNVLRGTDRRGSLKLVLSVSRDDALHQFDLSWNMREILEQQEDSDLLISYAKEDEEIAEIISQCITSGKPGFWPIVFELVQAYPTNRRLLAGLTAGIEQQGRVIAGPFSQFYEERQREVERILDDPETPQAVRPWLRDVADGLRAETARQVVWEYDLDVNDLRRHIQDRESPERIWAIGRVLKYAEWKDIRKLLTVEDVAEALPQVDLPEKKRRMIERALEAWLHEA